MSDTTDDSDISWLTGAHFPGVNAHPTPDIDPDDEELPETPDDVISMLGFDPLDMDTPEPERFAGDKEFEEKDHPRAPDGRFGNKSGEHAEGEAAPKQAEAKAETPEAAAVEKNASEPAEPTPLFHPDQVAHLPDAAVQPVKDKAKLFADSAVALDDLKTLLDKGSGVANQLGYKTMQGSVEEVEDWDTPGGMLFIAPLKGEKRATEKVEGSYGGDWSQLIDTVRCSLAADSFDEVKNTLDALLKAGLKLSRKPKDRFAKPVPGGYRDLLLNVTMPNGIVAEMQLHVKPMLKAKVPGHKLYETTRELDLKPADQWTPEEAERYKKAVSDMTTLYGNAWRDAIGGKPAAVTEIEKATKKMAGDSADEWIYQENEGAFYRRPSASPSMAVTDIWQDGAWKPYKGEDRTKIGLFSDVCENPEAQAADDACWEGYEQAGMKDKGGRQVPNCIPAKDVAGGPQRSGGKFKGPGSAPFKGQ